MIPFSEAFSYIIKELRESKKMSKAALAEKAGLHQTYIGLLETGKRSPNIQTIEALSKALDIRPSVLAVLTEKLQDEIDKAGSLEKALKNLKRKAKG
jgi:transcriptional regulator with XRE-family HTH domain